MTVPVGGLRARLIRDSLYYMLYNAVDDLDWFDTNREHSPITFNPEPLTPSNEIPVNTCALADGDTRDVESEMGSLMQETRWIFYVDFYAENNALGLHFSRDIKDILQGRMPSIDRSRPDFVVSDYSQATPSALFYCQIENVATDRPDVISQPYQKFWFTVRFDVCDEYTNEDG